MTRMVVFTKSYAPDFELCADLSRSILESSPGSVHHHIVVPRRDIGLFSPLANSRTHIHCEAAFLPRTFVAVPFSNMTANLRRPFPPIRGWILQQIIKLAAAASFEADVVLIADSDVEFVRSFSAETFIQDRVVRFFRQPDCIDEQLPRHVIWHRVARTLLGLPQTSVPLTDYISPLVAWDPALVRRMLERVESTTGQPWPSAIGGLLHFSECILYGVFVEAIADDRASHAASDDPLCHFYWNTLPLDRAGASDFLSHIRPTDVAAMISAKSHTPISVRRAAFTDYRVRQLAQSR